MNLKVQSQNQYINSPNTFEMYVKKLNTNFLKF